MILLAAMTAGVANAKDNPKLGGGIPLRTLDLSHYFDVFWESIQRSSTVYNPAGNAPHGRDQRRLSINAKIHLLTTKNLIGVSPQAVVSRLADDQGNELTVPQTGQATSRQYQPWCQDVKFIPGGQQRTELRPYHLSIIIDTDAIGDLPPLFGRVEGHFQALFARSYEEIDVPYKKSDEWIELEPGLSIRIAEAFSENGQYRYRIETKDDREHHLRFMGFLDELRQLPERVLMEQQLLDSQKDPIQPRRHPIFPIPGGNGSGTGGEKFGDIKTIRYVYAIKPYERQIPFVFQEIPVPAP
jgi:hypothetical protein